MTHARTLTRYACLAGLIAGLLVAVPSLAQQLPPSSPSPLATVTRVTGAGTSGSDILARVTANTKPQAIGSRIYWTQQVPVARSTLRIGALSALGRGVMHPGFQLALLAAGIAWNAVDGFHEKDSGGTETLTTPPSYDDYSTYSEVPHISSNCSTAGSWGRLGHPSWNEGWVGHSAIHDYPGPALSEGTVAFNNCTNLQPKDGYFPVLVFHGVTSMSEYNAQGGGGLTTEHTTPPTSVSPEDVADRVDPHLPPELAEQLWNGQPIPEWQEAISVIGIPATEVESKGQDMPEVATKVAQRAANIISQLLGEESPYPETGTGGQTADDEMVDMWNEPIPDFPEAEPEWQVEEITSLPDFSFGLGSGSCPAPVTIAHPLGGSFTIEFQRLCDLASMIRGAVIAICMILALYIVLGTRATTS